MSHLLYLVETLAANELGPIPPDGHHHAVVIGSGDGARLVTIGCIAGLAKQTRAENEARTTTENGHV